MKTKTQAEYTGLMNAKEIACAVELIKRTSAHKLRAQLWVAKTPYGHVVMHNGHMVGNEAAIFWFKKACPLKSLTFRKTKTP